MARFSVVVSPGAGRTEVVGRLGDAWKVRVAAPPERGRANAELAALLAEILGVPRRDVTVVAGGASRRKVVEVDGLEAGEAERRLSRRMSEPG
ncbi:MAG: DUF167 domain-containing protein [Actinobacteria bacterium]|nr:DUF167 domain-containing protein [Actinomycetota bacterium]